MLSKTLQKLKYFLTFSHWLENKGERKRPKYETPYVGYTKGQKLSGFSHNKNSSNSIKLQIHMITQSKQSLREREVKTV